MNYNLINLLCEQKRISIIQLAEKIGVSKAGIYRMITDKTMKVDTLEKIAQALEVPVSTFFDEVEKENDHHIALSEVILLNQEIQTETLQYLSDLWAAYSQYIAWLDDKDIEKWSLNSNSIQLNRTIHGSGELIRKILAAQKLYTLMPTKEAIQRFLQTFMRNQPQKYYTVNPAPENEVK